MSENVTAFPHNKVEALTMLYLQNQDLNNVTPEELFALYSQTYEKIENAKLSQIKAQKEEKRKNQI